MSQKHAVSLADVPWHPTLPLFAEAWGCFLQLRERLLAEVRPPRVRYSTIGETSVVLETPGEFQAELTLSVGTPKVHSHHTTPLTSDSLVTARHAPG